MLGSSLPHAAAEDFLLLGTTCEAIYWGHLLMGSPCPIYLAHSLLNPIYLGGPSGFANGCHCGCAEKSQCFLAAIDHTSYPQNSHDQGDLFPTY